MIYCTGKSRGTVKITWSSGTKETVTCDKPPIDIMSITSKNYTITYHHEVAPNSSNFQNTYDSSKDLGELQEPISYTLQSSSDLKVNDLVVTSGSSSTQIIFNITNNNVYGSILSNLQLIESGLLTEVSVNDGKGTVKRKHPGTAEWVVTCDDDCPPGQIKCEHPGYPGFCCIPCQGTASKINNLAAKIHR